MDEQKRAVVPVPSPKVQVIPSQPMPRAVSWQYPTKMVARYGHTNVQTIHDWWSLVGTRYLEGAADLVMVSGLQLFLDFFHATNYDGPWVHTKRWYDREELVPQAARVPWGLRIKPFLLVWKTYMKHHGIIVPQKMTRPQCVSISHWVVCYRLRMPPDTIQRYDDLVMEQLGRQAACASDFRELCPAMTR